MTVESRTTSLNLAAFCCARGLPYLRCVPEADGKTVAFIFAIEQSMLEIQEAAFFNNTPAPAYSLLESQRRLRRALNAVLGRTPR